MFRAMLAAGLLALTLVACKEEKAAEAPPPATLTASAVGHYCGMNLVEHEGPKGQVILRSRKDPIWFSSARDALSFTMLPEEPKDIAAIYVSDMAKATTWADPGAGNWIDARTATYVIGSNRKGGMGADEAIPFSTREAAQAFAGQNGGEVVAFRDVPKNYVLGAAAEAPATSGHGDHGAHGQHAPAPKPAPPKAHAH
jgi:copper chaperone NosL